ncbi:hypothetical protein SAMN05192549_101663 [Duganella sacchari]|uniref:DUF6265 domain-containing protein n=1 Tax=Duganella sacchari TaxID=551987 RepID=A0A1M7J1H7_9BURK|nr:DUF6265 family protein [Duganella sacchari]SHM46866.1 hypothetical protein SAMN05192549_101663 [Duganella sacchari]
MKLRTQLAAAALAIAAGSAYAAPLDQLSWLSGCWADTSGADAGSGEQWTTQAAGSMMGMSRTIRNGRLASYEFMHITINDDGKAVFHAQPSGQPGASFTAITLTATEVVFEDLQHDFPQRIIYRYEAPSTLKASIEGMRKGTLKRIDYPMRRTACADQVQTR